MLSPEVILNHVNSGGVFAVAGRYGQDVYKLHKLPYLDEPCICHSIGNLFTRTGSPQEVFEYICKHEGYYKDAKLELISN